MAEIIRTKIEGVAELKSALDGLAVEVATKIGVQANRDAAKDFRDTLKATAPHDPRVSKNNRRYGTLKENIRISRRKARNPGTIVFWVTIGHAFWGFFVETGTKTMKAQPWMLPAFDVAKERLAQLQLEGLRTGIERAAKRLARIKRRG